MHTFAKRALKNARVETDIVCYSTASAKLDEDERVFKAVLVVLLLHCPSQQSIT